MQRLEVSGAVRPIYGWLGVKRLSPKHGAVIAEVGGMRDLEMQILPPVWTKILFGRVKCQQDRGFRCSCQILNSKSR